MKFTEQEINDFIKTILSHLNYNIDEYDDRKEVVEEIEKLYGYNINERFDYYTNSNQGKYINQVNLQKLNKMLDTISNYLLFAKSEVSKGVYDFYKDDELKSKMAKKEGISLEGIIKELMQDEGYTKYKYYNEYNSGNYSLEKIAEHVLTIKLLQEERKKGKDISIRKIEEKVGLLKKLQGDTLKSHLLECPYIEDYLKYNNAMRDAIESGEINGRKLDDEEIQKLKRVIGYTKHNSIEIDKDIVAVAKSYFRFIFFKRTMETGAIPNYDHFDFFDKEHVMALLKFRGDGKFDSDLGCLIYDLNNLILKTELTPIEEEILDSYRSNDSTHSSIAEELGVSRQYVTATLVSIINKIVGTYEEVYEDWYYLNMVKGNYKTCPRCSQVKLYSHFGKDSSRKDGLFPYCKECDAKRKQK